MNKRIFAVIISLFVMVLAFAGCSKPNQTSSQNQTKQEDNPQVETKELKKLKIGYLATPGQAITFIAQEKDFFKEEGLETELIGYASAREAMNAAKTGAVDIAIGGIPNAFSAIEKGADLTIFGGGAVEGHTVISKPEKAAELKDLKNFKGKTFATAKISTGDVVFRGAMVEAGIDLKKDVKFIEFEYPADVLNAVKEGKVDGGLIRTPYRKVAEAQGLKVAKFSGEILPGHPCCRSVASTSMIKENPKVLEKFLVAEIKAYKFFKTNKNETIEILSKYIKQDKQILYDETYTEPFSTYMESNPDPNREGALTVLDFMKRAELISKDFSMEGRINTSIYKSALEAVLAENSGDEVYQKLKAQFKE